MKVFIILYRVFKQLLCSHYWDEGTPVSQERPFGYRTFKCDKCECTKVRIWNWGIHKNNGHHL